MSVTVPSRLSEACRRSPERTGWLERLPEAVRELEGRWRLALGPPFDDAGAAWVAPATRHDGSPAVLKLGMPHYEGRDELPGLRFWDGDPTVRLLAADERLNAMLLERCEPGTTLRRLPEDDQDEVIARLLRRLWRRPAAPRRFRPLSDMTARWIEAAQGRAGGWPDRGPAREGLRLFGELPRTAPEEVLLATDLHAGNVLRARRRPWLVIDPKPFVGDPAYDATQHLLNCRRRMDADPHGTIDRFADLLGLDPTRIRLWMFARAALETAREGGDGVWLGVAGALAP